jgi:hypothetical protein
MKVYCGTVAIIKKSRQLHLDHNAIFQIWLVRFDGGACHLFASRMAKQLTIHVLPNLDALPDSIDIVVCCRRSNLGKSSTSENPRVNLRAVSGLRSPAFDFRGLSNSPPLERQVIPISSRCLAVLTGQSVCDPQSTMFLHLFKRESDTNERRQDQSTYRPLFRHACMR